MSSYLNYFGCLLLGIFVADSLTKKYGPTTHFENYLLLGVTTYGGALMGSYFYNKILKDAGVMCNNDDCCCETDSSETEQE